VTKTIGPVDDPDRYELAELKSSGGEGELWRGSLTVDGAALPVAVKVVHSRRLPDVAEWHDRWSRQAELLRSLDHPAVVKVREVFVGPEPHAPGQADPSTKTLVLVMNWVEGPTLPEWVERNPGRDALESIRVIGRLAAAVDYLHSGNATGQPVLHRDIKPSNVIVTDDGVRLVDFGFVRILGDEQMSFAGTPAYLAPEVLGSGTYSEASDRYALGATAYFALTGEQPAVNDPAVLRERLRAVRGFDGREDLVDMALAMLDPDPTKRPGSTVSWAGNLAATAVSDLGLTTITRPSTETTQTMPAAVPPVAAEDEPRSRRPLLIAVGAFLLLALLGGGAALALGGGDDDPEVVASDASGSDDEDEAGDEDPTTTTEAVEEAVVVPDVVGEELADALAALADAGIDRSDVTIEYVEDVELPIGVVASQSPSDGDEFFGDMTLEVTERPSAMPDLTARNIADAEEIAENLGLAFTIVEERLDDTAPDGTVIEATPAAGEPLGPVQVVVARRPVIVLAEDFEFVEGDEPQIGQAEVDGQTFLHSLIYGYVGGSSECCWAETRFSEVLLSRDFRRFRAGLGLLDESHSGCSVIVEVLGDGNTLLKETIVLGENKPIDLDVTNVLRLRLTVTATSGDGCGPAFTDARLFGLPGEVDTSSSSDDG